MTIRVDYPPSAASAFRSNLPPRVFTVYLIRHGEAVHNVEEKRAKKAVLQSCAERGLEPNDQETKDLLEAARKEVLKDPSFFDAELTEYGKQEARGARACLETCVQEGLPAPQDVITSPLQRCLGTVQEIFPEQPSGSESVRIRVEERLRERLTGRPADNRHSSEVLAKRFPRFCFGKLRSLSRSNLGASLAPSLAESDVSDASTAASLEESSSCELSRLSSFEEGANDLPEEDSPPSLTAATRTLSTQNVNEEVETDGCVRKRAFELFQMLEQCQSDSVAVVTHKGFLRALERGCFGVEHSPEFKNCECRVYQIEMTPGNLYMDKIERLR